MSKKITPKDTEKTSQSDNPFTKKEANNLLAYQIQLPYKVEVPFDPFFCSKTLAFLSLQRVKGFGKKSMSIFEEFIQTKPVENWDSVEDIQKSLYDALLLHPRLKTPSCLDIEQAFSQVQEEIIQYKDHDISVIPKWSKLYPKRLIKIADAPILLFVKGNLDALHAEYTTGVIGARKASQIGLKAGMRLANILTQEKFVIISGLALGCDTVAHQGCLEAEGTTIAVLAHSLDKTVYPSQNQLLASQIIEKNGLLISEYPLGTHHNKSTFVQRDRWQAALSDSIVVIETTTSGGTMHTVRFAKEYNKIIGCFFHRSEQWQSLDTSQGNKILLHEGAIRLSEPNEIAEFIERVKDQKI